MLRKHRGLFGSETNMKKVIISGANGFIGKWLVKEFVEAGIEVYALVRNEENHFIKNDNVHFICCDMKNVVNIVEQLKNKRIDTFFHLAWEGSTGDKRADYKIQLSNVQYSCEAMQVAKLIGCKRFLAAGTITERIVDEAIQNGRVPTNLIYGICKKTTHNILITLSTQIGIELIWMQFSNVFGPGNRTGNLISYTLSTIQKGEQPEYSSATQPYDFIYIKDLVRAIMLLGQNEKLSHNQYFLGSGQSRVLREYLLDIPRALGLDIEMGIGQRADDGIKYQKEWFLTDGLVMDTGFKTTYSFEEAIRETYRNW